MNFDNFYNNQRNSSTLDLDDNDLLDDEWLYTSEPFDRTNTFRRKVKNEGESRNSVLEWLATDDDKIDSKDNNSINLEDISKRRTKDSINLFDNNSSTFNSDSLFDDLEISDLDSKFMSNFKLVSQDDFEDTEIEESLTKTNNSPEIHRCDSPNTEIDLEPQKIINNETINIEDNDSDSNITIINTNTKNKIENLMEDKKIEIINIDDNKANEISTSEVNMTKSSLLKKSELAQKRFLAKVEEAKKTIENLKPRKNSLLSEKELEIKTPKLGETENHDNNKINNSNNKKKLERRSYYYYADTGSDDEKDDNSSSHKINSINNNYSNSFKKTFNHFNSSSTESSFYNDDIYNNNENLSLPSFHTKNRLSDDYEDYPRKPPAPAAPNNSSLLNNLMDHANFESQPTYQSDIDTESNSSLHSDLHLPEYYGNQSFSNYNPSSMNNMSFYSSSPNLNSNNLYISTSPKLKSSFIPTSPNIKASTSFIPTSPSLKSTSSFIPSSPSIKANSSFIPTSPGIKPKKINTSFIPTSPSLKPNNSYIPSSPTISKYGSSSSSSLYSKQTSHISSPRIGYSSPSSPTPYSKSYESRTYDPIATYSIKDLINNKNPQILNHSSSLKSASSMSSTSTYKPSSGYGRKSSLEQNPQLKNYLNKMASSQRSKSPSMLSTTSTNSSKYSSGRKTPNSRLGTHYPESVASSTSSSSKIFSKYKTAASSSTASKIGTMASTYQDSENKLKLPNSTGGYMYSSTSHSDNLSSSKIAYSGRLSKTPTPSCYSKSSSESRIPSPSPYSKRSITPYY
ncbi:hypothetical protein BCR36DRAFT_580660 [Piromyces finnis]|uniref:Uncharacterized protein n=1 Tax=Piromyces finnis TaxID=1754191 RepID=A0A1Y1VIK2_9FUNG|nr:hypothetical protein BCR36DRAFT_580660 [Piromyces finnis]|eukprot:ORX57245.1 hypothetical protein BCR36DRAFT_580660 [Piromyces finnis]